MNSINLKKDLIDLKKSNKNIPTEIQKIYILDLYDSLNRYLNGCKKLICLHYNYSLIISDDMSHLSINDIIENLTNIAKAMSYKPTNILEISGDIEDNIYNYLNNLNQNEILNIFSSFYNNYIDPTKLNVCQYHHVIDYFLLIEQPMPPKMFNFFNTLISEDNRINDIIDIPNIILYFSVMNMYSSSLVINSDIINKIKHLLKKIIYYK